jgi:hypothetical protein
MAHELPRIGFVALARSSRRGDAEMDAKSVEAAAQPVGENGVDPPGRRDLGDHIPAIAQHRALDDDASENRPRRSAGQSLGGPQFIAGVQGGFRHREARAWSPDAGADAIGRERAQSVERGAMVETAQSLADQPPQIVELAIMGGKGAIGAHDVERIVDPSTAVRLTGNLLPVLGRTRDSLGRRIEALDFDSPRRLPRVPGAGGAPMRSGMSRAHFASSAQSAAGETQ